MTDGLTYIVVWLNALANALGRLLAPIGQLPGWLSATLVAAATGVLLLLVYKYTSHQRAIKAVRNDIKANLLAVKLFKDSAWVTWDPFPRRIRSASPPPSVSLSETSAILKPGTERLS